VRDLTWPPSPKGAPAFCRVGTCRKPGSRGSLVVQSTPGTPRGPVHPGNSSWSSPPRELLVVQSTPETPRGGRVRSRPRFARHLNIGLRGTGSSALPKFATYALDRQSNRTPDAISTRPRVSSHCGSFSFATASEVARQAPRPARTPSPAPLWRSRLHGRRRP